MWTPLRNYLPVFSIHSDNVNTSVNRCRQDPFFIRDKNPNNIPTFVEKLEVVDWSSIKTCDEPDIAYKRFHEMYTKIYNDCFPLKKATRKQRRFKKPWLKTKALLRYQPPLKLPFFHF